MKQLIECVPNISEGRDKNIIDQVTAEIEKVEGVKLLDVDPGMTTNRTVITFVGEPEPVCEAAYRVVKKAAELIDMSQHHGAHPRQGATDVCPLIPVSNITMEEVVEYAHKLGKRLGDELNIPIYCYEEAAYIKERRNLAYCRTGEITLPAGVEMVMPGDNVEITVELIYAVALNPGLRFAIREGGRTVGSGQITEVYED